VESLRAFRAAPPSELEQAEGLEQLRFLDQGAPVTVVPLEPFGWDPIELNNPGDVPAVERQLAGRGID
jgi:3-deoxy-manno-octulosonate cytidylyltransferase (CMP-KDO synthetase)